MATSLPLYLLVLSKKHAWEVAQMAFLAASSHIQGIYADLARQDILKIDVAIALLARTLGMGS